MLKVELHAHTSDDPVDRIPHTAHELIDRAAALGYRAVAITLHDRQLEIGPLEPYARERGVTLIPGVERAIAGKHVLLIGFPSEAERVRTFDELAVLKKRAPGLVVAPHPFYPAPSCLGRIMHQHPELFDASEFNYMYTSTINFNRAAERWARKHGKPMVGNSDVHRLAQLGVTYSLVDAEPTAEAICAAIRAGRVELRTEPLSLVRAGTMFGLIAFGGLLGPRSA